MKNFIFLFFVFIFFFSACKDVEDQINAEDQLVAISQIDLNFDFTEVSTFSISDTISGIYIDALGKETETKTLATYQKELIIKQMEDRGFLYIPFSEMSNDSLPDLFFDLVYVENKFVQVSGYGWWYDYYDPYWFSCWEWGAYYPYYPVSYTTITSYTAKSLIMDCMFLKESSDNKYNAQSCFFGLVRGIAGNYKESEISQYINQCFDQTPELNKN
ncbi:MAG: hypothetical protein FWH59_03600 [Lentimicrobiaceae bacterium]|nr:hypothetical protein [Lentimicrobiaceae bacterium]